MVEGVRKMKGYRQVSIPDGVYEEAERYAENHSFTSVADLVKYLIRKRVEENARIEEVKA